MLREQGEEAKRLPAELCVQLVEQFDLIGWDRLEAVSPSLREFDLTTKFVNPSFVSLGGEPHPRSLLFFYFFFSSSPTSPL